MKGGSEQYTIESLNDRINAVSNDGESQIDELYLIWSDIENYSKRIKKDDNTWHLSKDKKNELTNILNDKVGKLNLLDDFQNKINDEEKNLGDANAQEKMEKGGRSRKRSKKRSSRRKSRRTSRRRASRRHRASRRRRK